MRRPRGQGGSPARPDRAAGALRRRDESPRAQPAARARPQTRTDDRRLAMIVHMVILKVKKSVAPKDVERVFAAIGALKQDIPGILSYSWGAYASPEGMQR